MIPGGPIQWSDAKDGSASPARSLNQTTKRRKNPQEGIPVGFRGLNEDFVSSISARNISNMSGNEAIATYFVSRSKLKNPRRFPAGG
jgi:hypothetical protein